MENQSFTLQHFPFKQDINISSNIAVQTNKKNKMLHANKGSWCNLSCKHLFSLNAKRNTGLQSPKFCTLHLVETVWKTDCTSFSFEKEKRRKLTPFCHMSRKGRGKKDVTVVVSACWKKTSCCTYCRVQEVVPDCTSITVEQVLS